MNKFLSHLIFLFFVIGFGAICCPSARAQNDPGLAAQIALWMEKAKSEYNTQNKAMLLQTTGHVWTKEEIEKTTEWQKKYNDYLDSFRDIIVYAAQIYGFYYEIDRLIDNLGGLTRQLKEHSEGAFAAALTPRRNQIYRDIILGGIEIVNDVRQVCLSDVKMTEAQRVQIVFSIRPKLKRMNLLVRRLTRAVKYTSFNDVWYEIDEGARPKPADKKEIVSKAMRRWKHSAKR